MAWAKIDDKLHGHPKSEQAGLEAIGLWTLALSYCAAYLTDGLVTRDRVLRLAGERGLALADRLVAAGLWEAIPEGGWQFHDWANYQPTKASVEADRAKKAQAGRAGGLARGFKWTPSEGEDQPEEAHAQAGAVTDDGAGAQADDEADAKLRTRDPVPSRPVPVHDRGGSAREGLQSADGPDLIAFAAELAAEERASSGKGIGTSVAERVAKGGVPTPGQRSALRKIYDSRVTRTNQGPPTPPPMSEDERWVADSWREARRRLKLPDGEPERRHVVALWEKAAKSSASAQAVSGWKPTAREIVAHWIKSYLSDGQSHAGGIVDQKHPIALLVARAGETYGMPPKPQRKPPASPPPEADPPPARLPPSAEVLAMAAATMEKLGAPGRVKRPSST